MLRRIFTKKIKMSKMSQYYKGFTIAEVLITLGIIGIVATLTIPDLLKQTNEAEYKSMWKKEYAALSQVFGSIISENGGTFEGISPHIDWGPDSNTILTFFADKMSVQKYCDEINSTTFNCWHPPSGKDADAVHLKTGTKEVFYGVGYPAMILNDGSLIYLYGGSFQAYDSSKSYGRIAVDVNGKKSPNVVGKDIFGVYIFKNKLVPFGSADMSEYQNTCDTTGFGCSAEYLYK